MASGCAFAATPKDEIDASISKCGLEGQIRVEVEGENRLYIRHLDPDADYKKVDCFVAEVRRLELNLGLVGNGGPATPEEALAVRLEKKLSQHPCIGPMERWHRKFAYGLNRHTGGANTNIIHFAFREAGKYEFREGRSVVPPDKFAMIDDRPYRVAFGTYNPATGQLAISFCGRNVR